MGFLPQECYMIEFQWWCVLCHYWVEGSQHYEEFRGPMADFKDFFKSKIELLGTDLNGNVIIAHNIHNAWFPYPDA